MALAIATNNAALRAAAAASSVNRDMETSMARLSSGKRINSASDDAAGVAISSRLTSNIRGTDQAIRNALDGQALIDTAEGAHKEIENILQRMREIAVQAANDTNNAQDRANLQAEMDALSEEINRIAGTTTWAGTKMLDAESSAFNFHIGAGVSEQDQVKVSIGSITSSALGLGGSTSSSSSSSSSGSGSGEASLTFTSGVNDTFDVSNGAEETNISAGLQAHLDSLSATVVGFDDPSTNRTRAASFDLSSITETITSAILTIRAKPLDDERAEGNDTIILSGFDTNGTALMPQYTVGLGLDAGPNNYFDFDWQIDGRPAVPNEGFEITIDLSNFAAQQGTSLNLLDDINTEKLLDIIIADDTLVDFVELAVSFPSTSSSASGGSITTPQKVGSEFQVNTTALGNQEYSDLRPYPNGDSPSNGGAKNAYLTNGNWVNVWTNEDTSISVRVFGPDGSPLSEEFVANQSTNNQNSQPTVASMSNGGFTISWKTTSADGTSDAILARIFNETLEAVTAEIMISDPTKQSLQNGQYITRYNSPAITELTNGNLVISYDGVTDLYPGDNSWGVNATILAPFGVVVKNQFQLHDAVNNGQYEPKIASMSNGGFVVAFENTATYSSWQVTGRTFNSDGTPTRNEVALHGGIGAMKPDLIGLDNGGILAVWHNVISNDISARVFDYMLNPITNEVVINSSNSNQSYPTAVQLNDDGFIVAWQSLNQDGSGYGVFGQRLDSTLQVVGTEFSINQHTNADQKDIKLASGNGNTFLASWASTNQDADGAGIFAQIFDTGTSSESGSSPGSSFSSSGPTLDSPSNSMAAITAVDKAIQTVNIQRSKLGAVSNRLSHTVNNLTNISSNLSAAQGGIEDADFAKETTDLAKNQILQQASTAMLAQANASKQNVLSLLQG